MRAKKCGIESISLCWPFACLHPRLRLMHKEWLSAWELARPTMVLLRSAPTVTMTITPTPARPTATTTQTGSSAEYSSARAPGFTATTGGGITAGLVSMAGLTTDAGFTGDVKPGARADEYSADEPVW